MLAVILSGHGGFASGIEQALNQIIGEPENFCAIDFPVAMSTDQLEARMREAINSLDTNEGLVFMTDLLGGTPFRTAAMISQERDDVEVLTGTNLQMAAEMLLERDELALGEFRAEALACGQRGMTSLADELAKQKTEDVQEDGI